MPRIQQKTLSLWTSSPQLIFLLINEYANGGFYYIQNLMAEGISKEKAETVKKGNKAGLTVETIADVTGLTIEEINAILNGKAE